MRTVVHQGKGMFCVAIGAEVGFSYTASVNLNGNTVSTDVTFEEGFPHFWDQRRQTDHHAGYGDQQVNI